MEFRRVGGLSAYRRRFLRDERFVGLEKLAIGKGHPFLARQTRAIRDFACCIRRPTFGLVAGQRDGEVSYQGCFRAALRAIHAVRDCDARYIFAGILLGFRS